MNFPTSLKIFQLFVDKFFKNNFSSNNSKSTMVFNILELINGEFFFIKSRHLSIKTKNILLFSSKYSSPLFSSKKHLIIFPIDCNVNTTVSSYFSELFK